MFNTATKIARDASLHAALTAPPDDKLGDRFELAVARRLKAWLDGHGSAMGIVEAWHDVNIERLGAPELVAQWDVTLVLTNGVLLGLECKTFEIETKDLDARLLNLQKAGTRPARMFICTPLYTAFHDLDWFRDTLAKSDRIRDVGMDWLAFTLPGQPDQYPRTTPEDVEVISTCPPFEIRLGEILAPYRPTALPDM